jgi:1,2-dihydroxy-3-keto-5-methylthiopentene dioxygenase
MTVLAHYPNNSSKAGGVLRDPVEIAETLAGIGVRFERWPAADGLPADASADAVLAAYEGAIEQLKASHGFQSVDVIAVTPEHPQKTELRGKFLEEHIHNDFEIRFFVDGRGLFYLHPSDSVYALLCERGDLISVPAGVKHWFDMGGSPSLKCIRFFTVPDGWQAEFTGSGMSKNFPLLEEFAAGFPL